MHKMTHSAQNDAKYTDRVVCVKLCLEALLPASLAAVDSNYLPQNTYDYHKTIVGFTAEADASAF